MKAVTPVTAFMIKKTLSFLILAVLAFPFVGFASVGPSGLVVRESNLPSGDVAARSDVPFPDNFATTLSVARSEDDPVKVGDIIEVKVVANPHGHSINLVSATLQYPTDILNPVATDYAGSDYSIFLDDGDVATSSGEVSVVAMQPYPGISQSSLVASFTFQVKKAGTVAFSFATGTEVYADDGLGTETGIDAQPLDFAIAQN
jgi:hypothetical protein